MTSHTASLGTIRSSAAKTLRPLLDFIKRHRNAILLISSIVLIILAVFLINLLITKTFTHFFSCTHLIDETLTGNMNTFCEGAALRLGPFQVPPTFQIGPLTIFGQDVGPWVINGKTIGPIKIDLLPPLDPIVKDPLEAVRKFVAWNIILAFAVASLVLAFIAIKIKGFVKLLLTHDGRKAVLTNLSLWLLIFAIFCSLFYFGVVVR